MSGKRKRKRTDKKLTHNKKNYEKGRSSFIIKDLISNYYPQVLSLREYLLRKLSPNLKLKKLKEWPVVTNKNDENANRMASFLDHTWIGVDRNIVPLDEKWKEWNAFCQISNDQINFFECNELHSIQSKIIDFAIWLLFSKTYSSFGRSKHLLCEGCNKRMAIDYITQKERLIFGPDTRYKNNYMISMKTSPWPQVLTLLGKGREKIILDLILDCGIFIPVDNFHKNYYQISGFPLGKIDVISKIGSFTNENVLKKEKGPRSASFIKFVRNRIMYGRGDLNAIGGIRFGLKSHHVLNRYPASYDSKINEFIVDRNTINILMYIFPRSFGLHNVFTNDRRPLKTNQPFHDYTFREDEINIKFPPSETPKIPRRLRGKVLDLTKKLQILHKRCPYKRLLDHYCPMENIPVTTALQEKPISNLNLSSRIPSIVDYATPNFMVFAFCRRALSCLIPREFWGVGETQVHNLKVFFRNVDQFIRRRRFETLSLHEVTQDLKISKIEWLGPALKSTEKLCQTDISKRWEIFYQFIYYLFDSILIPLIHTNFYVTESNSHRNRIFFFRHDVWKTVTEAALSSIKSNLFEEVELENVKSLLDSQALGFSQLRLLPKGMGVRPIMNLRKRVSSQGSKSKFSRSINSILTPIHNVLTLEKNTNPSRLGSTIFSVGDLFSKITQYKSNVGPKKSFYFVKVDVHAAFDSIPQSAVLKLISTVTTKDNYRISRHVEIKPGEYSHAGFRSKPVKTWKSKAFFPDDSSSFNQNLKKIVVPGRNGCIFIENFGEKFYDRRELLNLLTQHIKHNIVKIRNRYYRQKEGIPQGSVISSLLCNYFYADLETTYLTFLCLKESLLLRLTDDFLLVTTNISHAKKFLQIMHDGLPSYGLKINPLKTLVNFDVSINGKILAKLEGQTTFPYCGCLINMSTLDISRDRMRLKSLRTVDSLTVEYSKVPGKSFEKKILNSFKLQMHAIFLDPTHNSLSTILNNLHSSYLETASKTHAYLSSLPSCKRPGLKLVTGTFGTLVRIGETLVKRTIRETFNANGWTIAKNESCLRGLGNALGRNAIECLALIAFEQVFRKKQTLYRHFLDWLESRMEKLYSKHGKGLEKIMKAMKINKHGFIENKQKIL